MSLDAQNIHVIEIKLQMYLPNKNAIACARLTIDNDDCLYLAH